MHLPNGSQIFVESQRLTTEFKFTAVSNAVDAVLTVSTATGLAAGDIVIITQATSNNLINIAARIKSVSSNNVTLEGVDTTNKNRFPAGITGSFFKITAWAEIPCVQEMSQDGGEQQYYNYQCLSDEQEQQLPTYKSAVNLTYTFAHEFDNAIYPLLRGYDEGGEPRAMRMFIPKAKEIRIWSGVMSFNDIPQTTVNEMETVTLSCAMKGRYIFAAA